MCRRRCGIFLSTYNFQYVYTLKYILSAIAAAVATKVRCIVGYLAVLDKKWVEQVHICALGAYLLTLGT